jgi:ATP-dependent DNA helicase RecG
MWKRTAWKVDGKTVWVLDVPSGKDKPYVASGAIYVREGPNSQKLTTADEMRSFFQSNNRVYFDAVPCERFDRQTDFDDQTFAEFRRLAPVSEDITVDQVLDNLQALDDGSGAMKNGGVLFFGKRPEWFFPQAITRCVLFKGTSRVHIIDDKTFGGSLYNQYVQADKWIKDKLKVAYIIEGTGPRREVWEIPLEVFKEALINALSHRDYYEQGANTMVEIYDDRVEISNPGGLLSEVAKNFGKKSATRNPLIFGLFTRMHLVERIASGIPRMREAMIKAGLPEPKFETTGFFTAIFPRRLEAVDANEGVNEGINEGINSVRALILNTIAKQGGLSAPDIVKITGKGLSTVERYIAQLKKEDKVEYRGSLKTGGYYLK